MADMTQGVNFSGHLGFLRSALTRAVSKAEGKMPEARKSLITEVI